MNADSTHVWLTVNQCLERLLVARSTWDKWRQRGAAPPATRLPNGHLRIRATDLENWLKQQAEPPHQQTPTPHEWNPRV